MSDVLIVNIKWDEIERRNGSNISLLKTIIAVYQDIFLDKDVIVKKKLVFLVRDSKDNEAQRDKIIESLVEKLKENWRDLSKTKSKFKDYFTTEFLFLISHSKKSKFSEEMDNIRERFDRKSED